ncbi:hypothetical protein EIN_407850 [Entamoeba invadens IP1]|uniref:Uncharacterized protein n=1 Tax=Entamoeba invadens IP1 TaxID=370355 RepID=A0A0A1TWK3_ENTIV|nr:hypothetical protein EIN_407850 [Entamoeba invadens IP1]ELP85566.1 hypothetical protein EIN_407850 [Entamoeba invadens IP1]|eukprot:XP_004184912.1 hypothetical protein EIN_407850 [Entamoeba invadens IP1]
MENAYMDYICSLYTFQILHAFSTQLAIHQYLRSYQFITQRILTSTLFGISGALMTSLLFTFEMRCPLDFLLVQLLVACLLEVPFISSMFEKHIILRDVVTFVRGIRLSNKAIQMVLLAKMSNTESVFIVIPHSFFASFGNDVSKWLLKYILNIPVSAFKPFIVVPWTFVSEIIVALPLYYSHFAVEGNDRWYDALTIAFGLFIAVNAILENHIDATIFDYFFDLFTPKQKEEQKEKAENNDQLHEKQN